MRCLVGFGMPSLYWVLLLVSFQVIKAITIDKELDNLKRESATMYIEDLAEYPRVLLSIREMTFQFGQLRIQLILFCQLAGITSNRLEALG